MTKKDIEELLDLYKDQITGLREQVTQLREEKIALQDQNFRLQEGLLNIRAPEAYRDMIADRAPDVGISPEAADRTKQIKNLTGQFINSVEQPLFKNADDMLRMLSSTISEGGIESKSLHNNDES